MRVKDLIDILETMPMDSIITNSENHKLMEVCCEPNEKYPYNLDVWMVFEGEVSI